jgi:TAG lipase/steryl ester hydrolase/phospholipase A2/LPA acyltransferase
LNSILVYHAALRNYTNPNSSEASKGIQPRQNVRTWEKLSTIKSNCGIELALDECVAILNSMHRLKRIAERSVVERAEFTENELF